MLGQMHFSSDSDVNDIEVFLFIAFMLYIYIYITTLIIQSKFPGENSSKSPKNKYKTYSGVRTKSESEYSDYAFPSSEDNLQQETDEQSEYHDHHDDNRKGEGEDNDDENDEDLDEVDLDSTLDRISAETEDINHFNSNVKIHEYNYNPILNK